MDRGDEAITLPGGLIYVCELLFSLAGLSQVQVAYNLVWKIYEYVPRSF